MEAICGTLRYPDRHIAVVGGLAMIDTIEAVAISVLGAAWYVYGYRRLGAKKMQLPHYQWECPDCHHVIDALSENGLEVQRQLHIKAHQNYWVSGGPNILPMFKGRYQQPDGSWHDWNDASWLASQLISIKPDTRSPEELACRYKQKASTEDEEEGS